MFSKKETAQIDRKYFDVIHVTGYHIIVRSKNTGHYWDIESVELFFGKKIISIMHKHNREDTYHIQKRFHPRSVEEAQEMIKKHDDFHIRERVLKKTKKKVS